MKNLEVVRGSVVRIDRLAFQAALAGFFTSAALMLLFYAAQHLSPVANHLQAYFEGASILLWPSALLMLGAQTFQGGAVLFLFSACLNAGYFVIAAMLLVVAVDKIRSRSQILVPVAMTRDPLTRRIPEPVRSSRSIA